MNEKEVCAVIHDLLPLYVEQLTSNETNKLIEKHLEECEGCKRSYEAMKAEISEENERVDDSRTILQEVDYLKKIRTSTRKRILLGIAGTLCTVGIIIACKLFIWGTPTESYEAITFVENNRVKIQGVLKNGKSAYSHYKITEQNGQKQLVVYTVVPTIWNNNREFDIEYSLEEVKHKGLVIANQKITQSGNVISTRAAEIYANRHAYIGDVSKNNALANTIQIARNLGTYTNEYKTDQKPYEWSFHFESILAESNEDLFNNKMRGYALVLLAAIDNVDEIKWSYMIKTEEGIKQRNMTLTKEDANKIIEGNIKAYSESEERIEELLVKTGIQ